MIASVEESAVEVIDGEMKKLDAEVTRRPVAEVMAELAAAEDAAEAAAREARNAVRQKRKPSSALVSRTAWGSQGEASRLLTRAVLTVVETRRRKPAGFASLGSTGILTRSARGWIANRSGGTSSTARVHPGVDGARAVTSKALPSSSAPGSGRRAACRGR